MKLRYINAKEVKTAAQGRWLDILAYLAYDHLRLALERVGRHVPCPIHGGRDGFRLLKDAALKGGGVCNTCGMFPDGLALLQWLTGWTFPETVHAVACYLGITAPSPSLYATPSFRPVPTDHQEAQRRLNALKAVWETSLPADHPTAAPLRQYFKGRGLRLDRLPDCIRFHPRLAYYDEKRLLGHFPAMVALVVDSEGRQVTLHRTYLTPQGCKADVPSPKKLMPCPIDGQSRGCAIRLFAPTNVLGLAEGIETALAVQQVTSEPVWVAISAGGLEVHTRRRSGTAIGPVCFPDTRRYPTSAQVGLDG